MAKRPDDTVQIESVQGDDFSIIVDRATSFDITNDLTAPAEARFELGDDGSWSVLKPALATGTRFRVVVNNAPRLTGRLLAKSLPISADAGATVRVTIRTVLADADYASADPAISVRKTSLKDVILAAFEPLGLKEADFIFQTDVARDLMTGRASKSSAPLDLANIKEEDAKVHPPETIKQFAERHLNRFHATIWDAPDGRVVVGAPDDRQAATYKFICATGLDGRFNNLLSAEKLEDFEDVPTTLGVFGVGGGKAFAKARVSKTVDDPTLVAVSPILYRPVLIVDEGLKNQAQAEARARIEMSARSMNKDAWQLETDGLSYWDGSSLIPYGLDTTCDLRVTAAGGSFPPYLLHRVTLRGDADNGYTTQLFVVGRGIWQI